MDNGGVANPMTGASGERGSRLVTYDPMHYYCQWLTRIVSQVLVFVIIVSRCPVITTLELASSWIILGKS